MSDLNPIHKHAVHEGIDAQSWLGFEQRIEQRRFDSLLDVIRASLHGGDILKAQAALSEARMLRPSSPELLELEVQALALAAPASGARFWTRMGGAVVLLAFGVSMILGAELLRQAPAADVARLPLATAPPEMMADFSGSAGALTRDTTELVPTPAVATAGPSIPTVTRPTDAREQPLIRRIAVAEPPAAVQPSTRRSDVAREAGTVSSTRVPAASDRAPAGDAPAAPRAAASSPTNAVRPPTVESRTAPTAGAALPSAVPTTARLATPPPAVSPLPVVTPAAVGSAVGSAATNHEATRVADVLQRYARAYGELDARAAREVWPSVDERALARAFENLVSQHVSLRDCHIDVHGETADASCHGEARYVGKVGRGEVRTEPRAWRFMLRRDGEEWKIETAQAQRAMSSSQ